MDFHLGSQAFVANSCNLLAIFQCAYLEENKRFADWVTELEVLKAIVHKAPEETGIDQAGWVASHEVYLKFLKRSNFLKRDHGVCISKERPLGRPYVQKTTWGVKDHFVIFFSDKNSTKLIYDGYANSSVLANGKPIDFRSYPVV